jgi:hypothetical protein
MGLASWGAAWYFAPFYAGKILLPFANCLSCRFYHPITDNTPCDGFDRAFQSLRHGFGSLPTLKGVDTQAA